MSSGNTQAHRLRRIWVTPPEIFRSEVSDDATLEAEIEGRRFLLRSDFPVLVYFDGKLVGAAGLPAYPQHTRFEVGSVAEGSYVKRVRFRFPVNWGGDPNGGRALVQTEVLGRHGTCCLDAAWSDEAWPELPVISMLPTAVWQGVLLSFIPRLSTAWGNITLTAGQMGLPVGGAARLPQEIYVSEAWYQVVSLGGTPPINASDVPFGVTFLLSGAGRPAGDNQEMFRIAGGVPVGATISFLRQPAQLASYFKFPIRSWFQPWATGDTSTINILVSGPFGIVGEESLIVPVVWQGGYIIS